MSFPITRHRRLRGSAGIRGMVRETVLHVLDFIQPIFVTYGTGVKNEISSMPGVYHFSLDTLKAEVDEIASWAFRRFCCSVFPRRRMRLARPASQTMALCRKPRV